MSYNLVVFSALVSSGFTEEKIRTKLVPFGDNGVAKSILRTRIDIHSLSVVSKGSFFKLDTGKLY